MVATQTRKRADDTFYSKENIEHLEELKRLDDMGLLKFTKHELDETGSVPYAGIKDYFGRVDLDLDLDVTRDRHHYHTKCCAI